jgi:hypothetical protein
VIEAARTTVARDKPERRREGVIAAVVGAVAVAMVGALIAFVVHGRHDYTGLTTRQAVQKWIDNGGGDQVKAVAAEYVKMGQIGNVSNEVARAECVNLWNIAQTANDYGPIPDTQAQQYWSEALWYMQGEASTCTTAIDSNDWSAISRIRSENNGLVAAENELTTRINEIPTILGLHTLPCNVELSPLAPITWTAF